MVREWSDSKREREREVLILAFKREKQSRGRRKVSVKIVRSVLTLSCVCYLFSYFFDGFSMQIHPLFITLL